MSGFTEEELRRYSRHLLLQECGMEGQARLRRGRVLVAGAGGLGSPVLMYLAAAGVGTIGIADGDVVDISNLQRQIIHSTAEVGMPKTESAARRIRAINPHVEVITYDRYLTPADAADIIGGYDFVVDGTDNFDAKMLINDVCVEAGKPFSHGGILRFEGHTFTWMPGAACYRCIFGDRPPADVVPPAREAGVFGVIPGMLGTIQAAEVLKFLTGTGELLTDRLLTFDARTMAFTTVRTGRRGDCPVCSVCARKP